MVIVLTIMKIDKLLQDSKKEAVIFEIMNQLNKQEQSIAELSRNMKINRSTLRYYLNELIVENKILIEKRDDLIGRPTILKIDRGSIRKDLDNLSKSTKEFKTSIIRSPISKEILKYLSTGSRKGSDLISYLVYSKHFKINKVLTSFFYLKEDNLISQDFSITGDGEEFLKNEKQ